MLAEETASQIATLDLAGDRPVVICDVDEVVVHFTRAFETFLLGNGHALAPDSLALDGNIRGLADGRPAPRETVGRLVDLFFERHTRTLEPIDGAVEALMAFGETADVVMLSNLPAFSAEDRRANLADMGIRYPLVVNTGPKGPAVRKIASQTAAPAVFIDDSPGFIASAREHAPHVHLVHFMHDRRFARFVAPFDYLSLRAADWAEAQPHVLGLIRRA